MQQPSHKHVNWHNEAPPLPLGNHPLTLIFLCSHPRWALSAPFWHPTNWLMVSCGPFLLHFITSLCSPVMLRLVWWEISQPSPQLYHSGKDNWLSSLLLSCLVCWSILASRIIDSSKEKLIGYFSLGLKWRENYYVRLTSHQYCLNLLASHHGAKASLILGYLDDLPPRTTFRESYRWYFHFLAQCNSGNHFTFKWGYPGNVELSWFSDMLEQTDLTLLFSRHAMDANGLFSRWKWLKEIAQCTLWALRNYMDSALAQTWP